MFFEFFPLPPLPLVLALLDGGDASGFKSGFFASPSVGHDTGFTAANAGAAEPSLVAIGFPHAGFAGSSVTFSPLAALSSSPPAAAAAPAGALASASLAAPSSSPPITASPRAVTRDSSFVSSPPPLVFVEPLTMLAHTLMMT